MFGGWNGTIRLNDLFEYDIDGNFWTEICMHPELIPAPRAGMSMCAVGEKIYLFGGSGANSSCFNDIHIFDTKISTWQVAAIFTDN